MTHSGYSYRLRKRNNKKTYWSCCTEGCPGSCVLINGDVLKLFRNHTHEPAPAEKYKRQDFKFRMRELALMHPDIKPADVFEILLGELDDDAADYAKTHRKFYTTYASAIRMRFKCGKFSRHLGDCMEYDGYRIQVKYQNAGKSVWGCVQPDCPAEYIFDAKNEFDGQITEHNHLPA